MQQIEQEILTGERALFKQKNTSISRSVFQNGESPLKESKNIKLSEDIFRWKYPLWYSKDIEADNISMLSDARSGIWYTNNINISNSTIDSPKTFRRSNLIKLNNVQISNAEETLWNCKDIELTDVSASNADYFAMNSQNIKMKNVNIVGNYAFDGAENIEISNSKIITKDAFWNCDNVLIKDSVIVGQYLGWNSKNITFVNCVIESEQGFCYMENVKTVDCRIINTDLAFEYSTVDIDSTTTIDSIKNPLGGKISAPNIGSIIEDDSEIDHGKTILNKKQVNDDAV
ncbi:DUF3737 family protein [Companilactobacillus metriopterae]|uniref:DUF3737 family protein n=1 Tax=Companilactobacillus metriopterae TaxID=1909267 RepID=UPI00100B61F7|nr:DUF3737 family protein [Companilactobacillus metriopterae]